MTCILLVPLIIPLFFVERIYIAMGQDAFVADAAATYVKIMIPGCVLNTFGNSYGSLAMGHRVMYNGMIGNISATIVHVILASLLTQYYEWGMAGIAIASSI